MNKYLILAQASFRRPPDYQEMMDAYLLVGFVFADSATEAEKRFLEDNQDMFGADCANFMVVRLHDTDGIIFGNAITHESEFRYPVS